MVSGDNIFVSSFDATSSFSTVGYGVSDEVDDEVEDLLTAHDDNDGRRRRRCGVAIPANEADRHAAAGASRGMRNDEDTPIPHPAKTTMKIDATARRRRGLIVVEDGRR